ncbi:MAG: hypothetical protein ACRDJH_04180 [Thermomicrobiales bacterium]
MNATVQRRSDGNLPPSANRPKAGAVSRRQVLGASILVAVIMTIIGAIVWDDDEDDPVSAQQVDGLTVVKGYGGKLKEEFLEDPKVIALLAERYNLRVDIEAVGSIEAMCDKPREDTDYLWVGDQSSLVIYNECDGTKVRTDNIYNSPVVLYSWAQIADALVSAGLARVETDGVYTIDFDLLVEFMMERKTWEDIGITNMHGKILVHTTDPNRSNSGFLFAGMLANSLNGDVVTATTVETVLPDVQAYFDRLGYMEPSSGELFRQFLRTGQGAKPIVALYESQIPEHVHLYPNDTEKINRDIRILYPRPTVWATHPFIARTDNGELLLTALLDPDIQRLAWQHGQRPNVPGVEIDPDAGQIPGILEEITSVIDMPAPSVMFRINAVIANPDQLAPAQPSLVPVASPAAALTGHKRTRSQRQRLA